MVGGWNGFGVLWISGWVLILGWDGDVDSPREKKEIQEDIVGAKA